MAAENRPLTSLRALAALWVFVAHLGVNFNNIGPSPAWTGMICGWLGVDIFFVLSGFILADVYAELRPAGWPDFIARRLVRVFPLNIAVVGGAALLALLGYAGGVTVDWHYLPWHLLMLQSFVPGQKPGWIFVNWSVGIELICYLFFPLAILAMRRMPAWALAGLALAAAAWSVDAQLHYLGQFWNLPAILRGGSSFALGVAVGALTGRLPRLAFWQASALEIAGFAIVAQAAMGGFGTPWCAAVGSWRMASLPCGAAILIFALASDSGMAAWVLRQAVPFYLGRISFSIYLLHNPMMAGSVFHAWMWQTPYPGWLRLSEYSALLLLAVVAAASATYFLIEAPARRWGQRWLAQLAKRPPARVAA